MSNIDKHAVQAVADLKAGYTLGHADVAILNELARIALASLEAEPVAEWTNEQCMEFLSIAFRHAEINGDLQLDDIRLGVKMVNGSRAAMLQGAEPVTTAYKLPFDRWLLQQTGTIDVECGCVMTEVFFHWLRVAYEAGNSPVIQDGWVACVERMPSAGEQVLAYRPDAPESNDPLIKMATYVGGSAHGHGFDCYCKPTHWMPLPAAPQQED